MILEPKTTHVAYRCPECGTTVYGLVGKFALSADMLRLKCECGGSHLDIAVTNEQKLRLSVPCIFCKTNHSYVVSQSIFFGRELFLLNCPYANMDIGFIGDKEKTDAELERTGAELERLLADLETDDFKEMQPRDINEEDVLPSAEVYDAIRFLVKTLEDEGGIDCPCHAARDYELRFTEGGIEVYCPTCGASHAFSTSSPAAVEEYLGLDELELK